MAAKKISGSPKVPKPRKKGKKPKPKKFKPPPDIKSLDVFKVVLGKDAGAQSSKQSRKDFEAYVKNLSQKQLSDLEKQIMRLQNKTLENKEDRKKRDKRCFDMIDVINQRIQNSATEETTIGLQIKKRLETLPVEDVKFSETGNLKAVCIEGDWINVNVLISHYFGTELTKVTKLLAEGKLISRSSRHGPRAFIKRRISYYLIAS